MRARRGWNAALEEEVEEAEEEGKDGPAGKQGLCNPNELSHPSSTTSQKHSTRFVQGSVRSLILVYLAKLD